MTCNCGGSSVITPLGCGQPNCSCVQPLRPVSGCVTTPSSCQCQPVSPCNPNPYYNQAAGVQESHCSNIMQQFYTTGIISSTAWNVPACAGTAIITFPGLQNIAIGSYLWNPIYGHFRVISFDYMSSQVTIVNDCLETAAAEGTTVAPCTIFTVVDSPSVPVLPVLNDLSSRLSVIESWQADPCSWDIYDRVTVHSGTVNSGNQNNGVVLSVAGSSSETTVLSHTLFNDSCKRSKAMLVLAGGMDGAFATALGNYADITCELIWAINVGAIGTTTPLPPSVSRSTFKHKYFGRASSGIYHTERYVEPIMIDLDPGTEATVSALYRVTLVFMTAGVTLTIFRVHVDTDALFIAI